MPEEEAKTVPGGEYSGRPYLSLPERKNISVAVMQGSDKGTVFPIMKPRVVIGRAQADIIIKERRASRQHAQMEITEKTVVLRDLNSRNGTFVNEKQITEVVLQNQSEFRIGATVLMLLIAKVVP